MAEAKLYGQNKGGMSINGIIKDYYAYAGENISAGDLVEYVTGVAGKTDYGTSVDTELSNEYYSGQQISAVSLDENRVFVAHGLGSNSTLLYGMVLTINGTTITKGTAVQLSNEGYAGRTISTVKMTNGNVFVAHSGDMELSAVVCKIEGTTITTGNDVVISDMTNAWRSIETVVLDDNRVFIAHSYGSNYHLYGIVVTVNDTKITAGTDTELATTKYAGQVIDTTALGDGKVFIAHSYSTEYHLYGMVVSINGTTVTKGEETALSNSSSAGKTISTCLLNNGNVFVAHSSGSYYMDAMVCIISGTTITAGTDTTLGDIEYTGRAIETIPLPNGDVFIAHSHTYTAYYLYGMIAHIDGTTITVKTGAERYTELSTVEYTGYEMAPLLLQNGTFFIAHDYGSNHYLYAQIFGIDYENSKPTNNVVATDYETQIRKVTTGQFDGIAKTSGLGGNGTAHKDIVSIWTKEATVTQEFTTADGNTLHDANGDIFLVVA